VLSGGAAARPSPQVNALNQLRRSLSDRWLGGVCGGIAQVTGVPSWVWRLVFTFGLVFVGSGLALYILLWILVPQEQLYLPAPNDTMRAG
jgi:phage shock protein PspC (stress-responsive transcriptional regulator)